MTTRAESRRAAESAAEQARTELGLGLDAPIADILAAVEDLAGVPVTVAALPDQVAGMYIRRRDRSYVFVNGTHHPVRQRFTLAHEFGHHRLGHRQRVDATSDVHGSPSDPDEVAANAFAGTFLMPRMAVRNWCDRHDDLDRDLEFVVRVAAFFGTSAKSALIGLERAGCIRPAEVRRVDEGIQAQDHHGMLRNLGLSRLTDELARLYDAGDLPRLPASMTAAANRAHGHGLVGDDELAELLRGRPEASQSSGAEDDIPF